MSKDSPKPPPAPDPTQSAMAQSRVNRINQVTPFGTLTFGSGPAGTPGASMGGGGFGVSPNDMIQGGPRPIEMGGGRGSGAGGGFNMPARETATLQLSPELQRQFDLQNEITEGALMQALQRQGSLEGGALDFSGLPGLQSTIDFGPQLTAPQLQTQAGTPFQTQGQLDPTIDPSALPELNTDFGPATQRVSDALFQRGQMRLDPVFDRRTERLEQRLADQGLPIGSDAFSRDFRDERDAQTRAFTDLSLQATLAAPQEQARLFGQSLAARQQGLGEQQGLFGQQMAGRQLGMSEQAQRFGQQLASAGFGNQAQTQQFGLENLLRQQAGQEQLTAAELANRARAQAAQEQMMSRGTEFNELQALLGQQQTQIPQMGNFFAPGSVDFLGAQGLQQNALNNAFNADVARQNAKTGALGSLGGSALMAGGMNPAGLAGVFGGG